VAVVGVGHLGRQHARILSELPLVSLTGVVDIDAARAAQVAEAVNTRGLLDHRDLLQQVDAVTIAVPTELHHEIALPFLHHGISVLVEKPLARNVAEADELIAAAAAARVTLAVGHTERYNPALAAALPYVTTPRFIEVHRLSPFPERSLDIDVVLDLMIHDLDVVLALVRSEVVSVEAVGVPVLTDRIDIANARLKFASGCIANITASRISRERVRKVRFFQPDSYISIDYAQQEVEAWRLNRREGREPSIEGGKLPVAQEEPLRREMQDFVEAATTSRPATVTGEDARRAMALAEWIIKVMTRA
jgi:predicted dehydrogenase